MGDQPSQHNQDLFEPNPKNMNQEETEKNKKHQTNPMTLNIKTTEIGIQTIVTGTEIKLGSKTKKRVAHELGYFPESAQNPQKQRPHGSMSPILAAKQMRSSSQKIAKIINEHKAQLKVM